MGIQYGARDYKTLHRQISTTMLSGVVIFCIFNTYLCQFFAVPIFAVTAGRPIDSGNDKRIFENYFLGIGIYLFYTTFFQAPFEHWETAVLRCIF